ncbi:WGxxGxxG family protein [Paenibacillus senegalensis]|uniref:WGxxGxxG family protein n=1 Tax=Paenibacillus senegalensis TaxID=1465766 RepID=UPI000289D09A|nr:WGxxGxxG family protein [Paenibacillus senegalensis]
MKKTGLCTAALALTLAFAVPAGAAVNDPAGTSTPGVTTVSTAGTNTGAANLTNQTTARGEGLVPGRSMNAPFETGNGLNPVNDRTTEINRTSRTVDRNGNGGYRSTYTNQTPGNGDRSAHMSSYRVGMATRADNTMDYGWLGLLGLIGLAGLRNRRRNDDPTR